MKNKVHMVTPEQRSMSVLALGPFDFAVWDCTLSLFNKTHPPKDVFVVLVRFIKETLKTLLRVLVPRNGAF